MSRANHSEPPAAFVLAFWAVMAVGCGMAFKAGWELMGSLIGQ